MATLTKLKLSLKTGSETFSGTNARLYLVFAGPNAGRIYRVPTQPDDLEAGKLDIYLAECPDGPELDDITSVLLVNGMDGNNPAWRILWARLEAVDAAGKSWLLADAMIERWLDSTDERAPLAFVPLKRPFAQLETEDVVGQPVCRLTLIR
jgi:hypothetical protein